MKLLLDTVAFLWWCAAPERLPASALDACQTGDAELLLSTLSVWELDQMIREGRVQFRVSLVHILEEEQRINGLELLSFRPEHALALAQLPQTAHPVDGVRRALVAQAQVEKAVLVSPVVTLRHHGISVLWNDGD